MKEASRKKLLLMIPSLSQGGFERVCVKTAHLLDDDFDVTLLLFSAQDAIYDTEGLDVVNLNLPPVNGSIAKAWNVLRRARLTGRIKRQRHIDLTYSFGLSANLVNVLSRGSGRTLTGLRCSTDMESPRMVKLFCERSDRILSCSREIMRELSADYAFEKTSLIYNPLDAEDITARGAETVSDLPFGDEKDAVLIAAMARDDYIKGLWHLIKAFSVLYAHDRRLRLMIIGDGPYREARALAEALGVGNTVAFTGVKKNPFPYVAAADVYVLSSNHEGFPNALLEAMALGKPVIAADCKTGPREIVLSEEEQERLLQKYPDGASTRDAVEGAYGVLVPDMSAVPDYEAAHIAPDDRMLATALKRMLSDREKMETYGDAARKRAAMFTPERYREGLLAILGELS